MDGQELVDRARELMLQRPSLSPDAAYRLVLESDASLAAAHHAGEGRLAQRGPADDLRPAVAQHRALPSRSAGHDPLHPDLRHYSQLSQAERERALPSLRRLHPGERAPAGATLVEKFGPPAAGGGSFVVEAA